MLCRSELDAAPPQQPPQREGLRLRTGRRECAQQRRARAHSRRSRGGDLGGKQATEHAGCLGELARVHQRAQEYRVARLAHEARRRHLLEERLDLPKGAEAARRDRDLEGPGRSESF